jgi:hypothetical protein
MDSTVPKTLLPGAAFADGEEGCEGGEKGGCDGALDGGAPDAQPASTTAARAGTNRQVILLISGKTPVRALGLLTGRLN